MESSSSFDGYTGSRKVKALRTKGPVEVVYRWNSQNKLRCEDI